MKKTQVALAALALVASSAALAADVTLSGVIDYGVQFAKNDGVSTNRANGGGLSPNWLILSANEDLGNGLKANATYQVAVGGFCVTGTTDLCALGSKVSLTGDFGGLTVGNWLDPLFLAAASNSAGTDGGSNIGGILNPLFSTGATGAWHSNMVIYDSPNVNGFSGSYAHSFGGESGNATRGSFDSYRVNYAANGLNVNAAYKSSQPATSSENAVGGTGKVKTTLFGAGYDFGVAKANYLHLSTEYEGDATAKTNGFNVTVPTNGFVLGASQYRTTLDSVSATTYVLSAHYALSKRTLVYANYQNIKNDNSAIGYVLNAGGMLDSQDSSATRSTGSTVGIRHSF